MKNYKNIFEMMQQKLIIEGFRPARMQYSSDFQPINFPSAKLLQHLLPAVAIV
jgi:hypothetical protein